ncbi:uncharacterized protein LOC18100787 isoform X1 [Populus trichocarpa]|uniref:Uncharacterized protein n=1 Tax=Populus trichocarpa TaxID=3694 RepID=A0A3N7FAX2_POPTR|nr:uncharacterized protein LOC18100787 isoform X1 [Populus trichocarpa]|eukprot:XP_024460153.1 uncharacterized protein LOC18100787 isoform X1 [Populus trichocarpa]
MITRSACGDREFLGKKKKKIGNVNCNCSSCENQLLEVVAILAGEYDDTSFLEACKLQPSSPAASPRRTAAVVMKVASGIMCEPCNGKGWLLCDFCKGLKTNVKADNKRLYRRCPSCRAIGYVLCSKCKVFKCVTFPNYNDGEDPSL